MKADLPIPLIKRADGILKSKLVTSLTDAVKDYSARDVALWYVEEE